MLKVLTPDEASEIAGVSTATLERYRNSGDGPNFLRIGPGGLIKYLEADVEEWLKSCRQLPTEAEKMRAAATHGLKEASAAVRERREAMQALDKADSSTDPYAVTVSDVGGSTPGIVPHVFQNGQWVKGNGIVQTVVQPAADPHLLNCR